jgi:hypothetical protein
MGLSRRLVSPRDDAGGSTALTMSPDHTFSYSPFRNTSGEILGIRNFSYEYQLFSPRIASEAELMAMSAEQRRP